MLSSYWDTHAYFHKLQQWIGKACIWLLLYMSIIFSFYLGCNFTGGEIRLLSSLPWPTTVYMYFSSLHLAVLYLQNTSQLTCTNTWTFESIYKSLPVGVATIGQPSLEHLQKLVLGVRELCSDAVQCSSSQFELEPEDVPLCRNIYNFIQDTTKVIRG